jgi:hypothetical protein
MHFGYGGGSEFTANNAMDRYCPEHDYAWKGSEHVCLICESPGIPKPSGAPVIVSAMTIRQTNYEPDEEA